MKIVELKTYKDMQRIYPLVEQLNPGMTRKQFNACLKAMRENGYRCIAAMRGRALVGAAGLWTGTRFWCGKYIEIDNVVVDQKLRNAGIGKRLMDWIDREAARLGCNLVIADSYTHNHPSHRFYLRERYIIKGYCFVKELKQ